MRVEPDHFPYFGIAAVVQSGRDAWFWRCDCWRGYEPPVTEYVMVWEMRWISSNLRLI